MKYFSTRNRKGRGISFSEAIQQGLAPDGGLFVPERFPQFNPSDFDGLDSPAAIAERFLAPFAATDDIGDPLIPRLGQICEETFRFPIPLVDVAEGTSVLELFHGPSAAFKDVGARFLAECVVTLNSKNQGGKKKLTVLVATSGDTGGAVAAAFFRKPSVEVLILFPKGRISARQEKQLTAWGENVHAFSVQGDFDDCQRIAKEAFLDPELNRRLNLVSANSINIARLLPQAAYYAAASIWHYRKRARIPGFIVPSGNLGNAVAALWAKASGLPIGKVALATNANRSVSEFFASGTWQPRPTVGTLANAMDVGNPSNMERLRDLYPEPEKMRQDIRVLSVSDEEIRETISRGARRWDRAWCPHTATAAYFREQLGAEDWILVATAHPAKFESIVEPLVGKTVEIPPSFREILERPGHSTEIRPSLADLRVALAPQRLPAGERE